MSGADARTIVFFPEGPSARRTTASASATSCGGAATVFIVEESFKGTPEAQGFEEQLTHA
jgi:hypothetical protein